MSEVNTGVRYWKISPGQGAENWEVCRKEKIISIGWANDTDWRKTKFGDLTTNSDIEKIKMVLREYEGYKEKNPAQSAVIIRRFLEIKPGDKVVVYDKKFHINAMCEVIGEYDWKKDFDYPHTKEVKWIKIFGLQFDDHGYALNEDAVPLDIRPIKDILEIKIGGKKTVIEMKKKDWDIISDYAKVEPDIVHVTKDLIEKALDELGIKEGEATKIELITTVRKIVERDGNKLVDDETAWKEILNLLKKV